MTQAKRGKNSSKVINISTGGKRAKSARDHYHAISNKRRFIVFLVFFAIVVIITSIMFISSLRTLSELSDQKALLEDQKEDLEITGERLREEVEFTNTREFIEYMARKLLGWINPDDKKYVIID